MAAHQILLISASLEPFIYKFTGYVMAFLALLIAVSSFQTHFIYSFTDAKLVNQNESIQKQNQEIGLLKNRIKEQEEFLFKICSKQEEICSDI